MRSSGKSKLAGLLSPGGKSGRLADPVMGATPELRRRSNPMAEAATSKKHQRLSGPPRYVSFTARDDRSLKCVDEHPEEGETFTESSHGIDSGFRF